MKFTRTHYTVEKIVKTQEPSITMELSKNEAAEVAAILGQASSYAGSHSYKVYDTLHEFAQRETVEILNTRLTSTDSGRAKLLQP